MNIDFLLAAAYKKIFEAEKILLITHNNPDGDALSSICSMIEFLENSNKKYLAYCYDEPGYDFSFLPNIKKIKNSLDDFSSFDLIISLDCGSISRTKLDEEIKTRKSNQFFLEIDHHQNNELFSDLSLRFSDRASTTEILYLFFKFNKINLNKNIATCLLTGLITDTGNFLYPSTSGQSIAIASEMITLGVNFPLIIKNTFKNKDITTMKIWGLVLSRLRINEKNKIAYTFFLKEDFKNFNLKDDDFGGIAGFIGGLFDVKAVLFLRDDDSGKVKVSLRTNHKNINVDLLARIFGGGGHVRAAGFSLNGKLELRGEQLLVV
jgi:phosphoesterase RecJ-like protein